MSEFADLKFRDQAIKLPVIEGTENEIGLDISKLRAESGLITVDEGYVNTGSCISEITYINGEQGILRYRGYPIEELAEDSTFVETAYMITMGELPTPSQLTDFRAQLAEHEFIHESMRHHFEGFPPNAHPMAILSAMINAMSCFQPQLVDPDDDDHFMEAAARLMSKVRTIAAASYKKSQGEPMIYPRSDLPYTTNFLHMMFSKPNNLYVPDPEIVKALNQILILHADHEQNCSTSTVRMVGSSRANMYASVSAGVCALWGHLHGGANQAVIQMLRDIRKSGVSVDKYVEQVKNKERRLMGFGHRVYKNYDPRAKILKSACDTVLKKIGGGGPLLDIARKLEEVALNDPYFVERNLYPNVDFYSGIILRAIGIPVNMFTVMFAMGRIPGWIANWREVHQSPNGRIHRPRQIYNGPNERHYVPIEDRGQ